MLPNLAWVGAQVAKRELALECDYSYEARCQAQFRQLVAAEPDLAPVVSVPAVITELSTPRLLTTEWVPGVHIDKVWHPLHLTLPHGPMACACDCRAPQSGRAAAPTA